MRGAREVSPYAQSLVVLRGIDGGSLPPMPE